MGARTLAIAFAVAAALLCPAQGMAQTQNDLENEIKQIKKQLDEIETIKTRLLNLEIELNESRKAEDALRKSQETGEPTVGTAFKGAKARIDGRIFAGIFSTGQQGPFPNWSTDIPDAKLRFTFLPAKNITVVNRLNATGAKAVDFDYFYADFARAIGASNTLRLGQRKIDVGQETWVDNPVENMLITNSVSHVSGYGIGLATLGRFAGPTSPLYEFGFVNGPKGVTTRPSTGLPIDAKIGTPLPGKVFASASYFNTGNLGAADNSAISVAELSSAPAGATSWKRSLWEADLRYNYGPSGIRNLIPTGALPPVMLGATYGRFADDATGAPGRNGGYWFGEALVRLSPKLYAAARYSVTDLDDGAVAKLAKSPVAVNSYNRTSFGIGCALNDLVQWKTEYTINRTSGGASQPSLNQWATGMAAKY